MAPTDRLVNGQSRDWQVWDLLFLSSSLSSVVTDVNRRSKSIHNAASETPRSSPDAISMRIWSSEPGMRSGLIEKELVLPEMKSDKTQKKVMVYNMLTIFLLARGQS
jgi:hypothetical protein